MKLNFIRLSACTILILALFCSGCNFYRPIVVKQNIIRVLLVGGGASHDFTTWYKQADAEILRKDGLATVTYTERVDSIISYLEQTDILYLATNQDIKDPAIRMAIMKFVNTGHGLILGHPALWYNWLDWPSYNSHLVGGGAKSHDRYGAFDETVVNAKHPVTQGLEPKFSLKDERYHYIHDDRYGPKIETLISSSAAGSDKVYPSVFVVKLPMVRIVAIGLGHDAGSHSTTYYQTLLRNSVKWVAGK